MSSVDVPVALLGYGTVGAAVNRLLVESADDIERATGHRLRVVRALVRDPEKERAYAPGDDVLTTDFAAIRDDPSVAVGSRVALEHVDTVGIEHVTPGHHRVARELDMVVRLVGAATLVDGSLDVRVRP